MDIATKLDFLPGKKTLMSLGLAALTFVGHAIATLLLDQFAPGNGAAEMLVDQVAGYGYAASGVGAVYGLSAKAIRKIGISKAAPVVLAMLGLGFAGCGGSVTIAECTKRVDQAQVLKFGCGEFTNPEAQNQCIGIADAAIATARAGCQFAEPEVVAVAE